MQIMLYDTYFFEHSLPDFKQIRKTYKLKRQTQGRVILYLNSPLLKVPILVCIADIFTRLATKLRLLTKFKKSQALQKVSTFFSAILLINSDFQKQLNKIVQPCLIHMQRVSSRQLTYKTDRLEVTTIAHLFSKMQINIH